MLFCIVCIDRCILESEHDGFRIRASLKYIILEQLHRIKMVRFMALSPAVDSLWSRDMEPQEEI